MVSVIIAPANNTPNCKPCYFLNDGAEDVFLSSADWMDRNFFRRVEVSFPVLSENLKARVIADLDLCLSDNCQAWELQADGGYVLVRPAPNDEPLACQAQLLRQLSEPLPLQA